jgi:hypothetical protein
LISLHHWRWCSMMIFINHNSIQASSSFRYRYMYYWVCSKCRYRRFHIPFSILWMFEFICQHPRSIKLPDFLLINWPFLCRLWIVVEVDTSDNASIWYIHLIVHI